MDPFVIDGTDNLKYVTRYNGDGEEEYALDSDLLMYRVDGWEGLMNKHTGRVITPAVYSDFEMISKDLIRSELEHSNHSESVVMDRRGNVIRQ